MSHMPEQTLTTAEKKVLDAVRQKNVNKVTVKLHEGKITNIQTEEQMPVRGLDDETAAGTLRNMRDFESITVSKQDGKMVGLRRVRPVRVTEEENRIDVEPRWTRTVSNV